MNLTVINEDNAVYVDGAALAGLDLSACGIPVNVHALQWKVNLGWIEFKTEANGHHPANQVINSLPDWANNCVNVYNAKVSENASMIANAKNNQPQTVGTTVV
jgi:hypothetical protein